MALGSAVLFGASTPLAKLLLGAVDPWLLAGLLYLGTGAGLAAVHFMRRALALPAPEAPLRRADLPWLAAVVLFGGVCGPVLLIFGLARTPAAEASLLLNLEGLATMGIAWVAFRENVDRRLLLGAAAILAGASILSWEGQSFTPGAGALLIAGACLAWGIDNNLTRKLSSADPVQIAMIKGLVAGTVNLVLAMMHGAKPVNVDFALAAGILGFFGYGVSSRAFRGKPSLPRNRADRSLLFACPVRGRRPCCRLAGRTAVHPPCARWGTYGGRTMAPSDRAA